jgi:hypothetical protein
MRYLFSFLIVSLVFFACSEKKEFPADIIKPEKMKLVMWDFVKADVFSEEFTKREHPGTDTLENVKMQQIIFNKYKISKVEFYKMFLVFDIYAYRIKKLKYFLIIYVIHYK